MGFYCYTLTVTLADPSWGRTDREPHRKATPPTLPGPSSPGQPLGRVTWSWRVSAAPVLTLAYQAGEVQPAHLPWPKPLASSLTGTLGAKMLLLIYQKGVPAFRRG